MSAARVEQLRCVDCGAPRAYGSARRCRRCYQAIARLRVMPPRPYREHPLIVALFAELPPADSVWPIEDRVRWFRAFVGVDALLRGAPDDLRIEARSEWPYVSIERRTAA
jgi:hypothetical protein